MKRILIVAPHFPPSNLTAVHRSRLFAMHLPKFGWEPIILTVDEKFYEEKKDEQMLKLIPEGLRIEKVDAMKISKPRLIGDIGLRGFVPLYQRAKSLIQAGEVDFLYITIPSFYGALLGRLLHAKTKIKYGIDYIDPWVHNFPGSNKIFSRHWFSRLFAEWLEPIAVKKVSLITGVASKYYSPVILRNSRFLKNVVQGSMPYGNEALDFEVAKNINGESNGYFKKKTGKFQFVYAGAFLPNAKKIVDVIFKIISDNPAIFNDIEFYFIGTGTSTDDAMGFKIKQTAEENNIWNSSVFEIPQRLPYITILNILTGADAIFILGSDEKHYTPSKVFQSIQSGRPIFSVLHKESSAVDIIQSSHAGVVISIDENSIADNSFPQLFINGFQEFMDFARAFDSANIDNRFLKEYTAERSTSKLAALLNQAIAT